MHGFRRLLLAIALIQLVAAPALAQTHKLVQAKSGSGVVGYKDTSIQPWSGYHVHDPDRPEPPRVDPGPEQPPAPPPSDAIVLFDGKDLSKWLPAKWEVKDGVMTAGKEVLTTKEEFGDCQLHVEWATPNPPQGGLMNCGNNGVQMIGLFEVQIFDSWTAKLYPDGQAASIYSQTPPLVNACRKPGQWQSYDIFVTAPAFQDGKLVKPARITMLHNGVLVHLNQEVYGTSPHAQLATYEGAKPCGPITLLAHNNPVRFRNLWIRKLALPKPEEQKKQ